MKKVRVLVTITTLIDDSVYVDNEYYTYDDAEHIEDVVVDACDQAAWHAVTYGKNRDAKWEKDL